MKKILINHLPFIILILILGFYLGIKAGYENSWDGWRVGSAQTLLSNKHWVQDGFLKNYFLFLPQGYSKTTQYFDDPELRHHAGGIATGGFIGRRLYYTHYPSGYLLPTALLMKLGIDERFWPRLLEIAFSLSSLVILYWIFNQISGRGTAFLGTLFYGASTLFLDYADSLANQPIDELLRFTIIALSLLSLKYFSKKISYLIWFFYFLLSISSYDSTFFILAWLVGLDLIIKKELAWKKWLFYASAPFLAFTLQLTQNILYLGWRDAWLDLYGTAKVQILGSRKNFFLSHIRRLIEPFGWFFGVKWFLGVVVAGFGMLMIKISGKYPEKILDLKYLILGAGAVLAHFLFLPSLFFYQGRLAAIFGSLLGAGLTVLAFKIVLENNALKLKTWGLVILIFVLGLWLTQVRRTYTYVKNWPNNVWPAEKIDFDKKIRSLVLGDKVIFKISETFGAVSENDRYPMAASEDEYYIGAPILEFTRIDDLVRDYAYLKKRSKFPFNAIIIGDKKEIIQKIQTNLKDQNPFLKIEDHFVLLIK